MDFRNFNYWIATYFILLFAKGVVVGFTVGF